MILSEIIFQHVQSLPEPLQAEVLDFVKYLELKDEKSKKEKENKEWLSYSLSSAMRGMENEVSPYSVEDIKEKYS
ncbi:MAG: DUF2281 domain-containing protein [Nitrospinae bacterium]|nr:DUF2281 domain-containing protein [Nitrospinota bacterium]